MTYSTGTWERIPGLSAAFVTHQLCAIFFFFLPHFPYLQNESNNSSLCHKAVLNWKRNDLSESVFKHKTEIETKKDISLYYLLWRERAT